MSNSRVKTLCDENIQSRSDFRKWAKKIIQIKLPTPPNTNNLLKLIISLTRFFLIMKIL